MMRTSPLLDVLLSRTKQQILTATLLQPSRQWYLVELARHLHVRPSSLQRELKLLSAAGILRRHQNGNRVYFEADVSCPIFPDLAQIMFKTVGAVDAVRDALAPSKNKIRAAFIYGSIAAASDRATSDIDLMVIGSISLSEVASRIRGLERQLGRAINPTVYSDDEFRRRVQGKDHFLTAVLAGPMLFVIGGSNELANATANTANKTSSNQQARTRRPSRGNQA
jgi:predicted nucleotidyltransferase